MNNDTQKTDPTQDDVTDTPELSDDQLEDVAGGQSEWQDGVSNGEWGSDWSSDW